MGFFTDLWGFIVAPLYLAISAVLVGWHNVWGRVFGDESGASWVLSIIGLTLVIRILLFRTYALALAIEVPARGDLALARASAAAFMPGASPPLVITPRRVMVFPFLSAAGTSGGRHCRRHCRLKAPRRAWARSLAGGRSTDPPVRGPTGQSA